MRRPRPLGLNMTSFVRPEVAQFGRRSLHQLAFAVDAATVKSEILSSFADFGQGPTGSFTLARWRSRPRARSWSATTRPKPSVGSILRVANLWSYPISSIPFRVPASCRAILRSVPIVESGWPGSLRVRERFQATSATRCKVRWRSSRA